MHNPRAASYQAVEPLNRRAPLLKLGPETLNNIYGTPTYAIVDAATVPMWWGMGVNNAYMPSE